MLKPRSSFSYRTWSCGTLFTAWPGHVPYPWLYIELYLYYPKGYYPKGCSRLFWFVYKMRPFLGIYLELKIFVNVNFVFIVLQWHLLLDFQGVWKPKMIENPAYFEDNNPYKMIPIVSWPSEDCLLKLGVRVDACSQFHCTVWNTSNTLV